MRNDAFDRATKYPPEGGLLCTPQNRLALSSRAALERACAEGMILEAQAIRCVSDFSLEVDLCDGIKGFIPREEVLYDPSPNPSPPRDIAILTRVGKPVCFKVLGFTPDGNALLSRREAQRECYEAYIYGLDPGDVINARITHLEHFGAFADIGCGYISLMTIDAISVSRISHPRDRFWCGMNILACVRSIDRERGRVCISQRELFGTWLENASKFQAGHTVAGIIRGVESYGVFIELTPNLAGLAEYTPDVEPGQSAAVYIKSINPARMKIKLVIVDVYSAPPGPPKRPVYVDGIQAGMHVSYWRYSPPECDKVIETRFDE